MDFSLERPSAATAEPAPRRGLSKPLIAALIGVVIVAAALVFNFTLQGPLQFGGKPALNTGAGAPSFDVVRIDPKGNMVMAGRALAGATVIIMDGEKEIGRVTADENGYWQVEPEGVATAGKHVIRADQIGANNNVMARVEVPFALDASQLAMQAGEIRVIQGTSLWRIARRAYGAGINYTLIYEANKDQIKNPDLIYPGQVFNLPAKERG